jgi:3-methyladenine DNA glycosylase/8-oxoguanine DNA glycosylase
MTATRDHCEALDLLSLARRLADFAQSVGFQPQSIRHRHPSCHMGAVLADSILQAGVNYRTVVRPRVERIVKRYPECATLSETMRTVDSVTIQEFLLWRHADKVGRFMRLCDALHARQIEDTHALGAHLKSLAFRSELLRLEGIGPKTVDYLSCLVGVDTVAVDRHVRSFARQAGLASKEYAVLQSSFCYAADLLGASRRSFDAWIWTYTSVDARAPHQLKLFLD